MKVKQEGLYITHLFIRVRESEMETEKDIYMKEADRVINLLIKEGALKAKVNNVIMVLLSMEIAEFYGATVADDDNYIHKDDAVAYVRGG